MDKIVNIKDYPQGLEVLAKELSLPIPETDTEARKNYVANFMEVVLNL